MSSGKVVLGLLAGITAGALLGILCAPDKGSNTRKKISKKSDDYVDNLKDKFFDFLETINDRFQTAKDDAEDLLEKGKSKAEDLYDKGKSKVNEAKNAVEAKTATQL